MQRIQRQQAEREGREMQSVNPAEVTGILPGCAGPQQAERKTGSSRAVDKLLKAQYYALRDAAIFSGDVSAANVLDSYTAAYKAKQINTERYAALLAEITQHGAKVKAEQRKQTQRANMDSAPFAQSAFSNSMAAGSKPRTNRDVKPQQTTTGSTARKNLRVSRQQAERAEQRRIAERAERQAERAEIRQRAAERQQAAEQAIAARYATAEQRREADRKAAERADRDIQRDYRKASTHDKPLLAGEVNPFYAKGALPHSAE